MSASPTATSSHSAGSSSSAGSTSRAQKTRILIYSDDSAVRASMKAALGQKLAADLPSNEVVEFATADALHAYIDERGGSGRARAELIILDGEAVPEGGMGISRQLKDEIFECPPIMLIVARADDAWLAKWSRADTTLIHPIDPFTFASKAEGLLRLSA